MPAVPDDYIHRVGRTARAEATGDAFTFVSPDEEGDLKDIERVLTCHIPRVVLPDFDYTVIESSFASSRGEHGRQRRGGGGGGGGRPNRWHQRREQGQSAHSSAGQYQGVSAYS